MHIIDMIDSPHFNPATNHSRGDWSLRDVSSRQVTVDPQWNKPRYIEHNAMNCVNAERTIWRCLVCGRSCFDLDNHGQRRGQPIVEPVTENHEPLTVRPAIGTSVVLLQTSWYLKEYHGAVQGQVGTVVRHSGLVADDTGILVDWGVKPNDSVRMDLDEIALSHQCPEPSKTPSPPERSPHGTSLGHYPEGL
ncbi:hypothetical protein ANMWB30_24050 [Arthrobacter sp. MWB30]|nr:hypothetical protein ANMWB30_24050 [Arthrobacter sp. MWB30]